MTTQTYQERLKELLWKLQNHTLSTGYPVDHREQQTHLNTTLAAINALISEGIDSQEKVLLGRYVDEESKEDKEANGLHDYARYQLSQLRTTFGIEEKK